MAPCHHASWVELSNAAAHRLIDPGRLGRLVGTLEDARSQCPQVVLCVGRGRKQQAVDALLPNPDVGRSRPRNGFANLFLRSVSAHEMYPALIADCTYDAHPPVHRSERRCHEKRSFPVSWTATEGQTRHSILTRLIFPFADAIAIFADDFGELDAVLALLQRWVSQDYATDLPWKARPRVCILADQPQTLAERTAQKVFRSQLRAIKLRRHFSSIRLVSLSPAAETPTGECQRAAELRRILLRDELKAARTARRSERLLFAAHHFTWFFTHATAHVARSIREPFSFMLTSRVHRPLPPSYDDQLSAFFRLAVTNQIPLDIVVTLVASSILLDAYPPAAHRFFPVDTFTTLYEPHVRRALEAVLILPPRSAHALRCPLDVDWCIGQITACICGWVDAADRGEDWALRRHARNLANVRQQLRCGEVTSHACCLSCLACKPQHPLRCGHTICEACVVRHGQARHQQEYSYCLRACPFCGAPLEPQQIDLKPPTAGVRAMTLDAGGIRGVVSLTFLERLQEVLGPSNRVQDHFDIALGTSAGGLIVIALFRMHWNVPLCTAHFCHVANATLRKRRTGRMRLLSAFQDLGRALLTGAVYSGESVARPLQACFGTDVRLFAHSEHGPAGSKFAVTATTLHDASSTILANYNLSGHVDGADGDPASPHRRLRRDRPEDEPRLWEVAAATSAAPPYFQPVSVGTLGKQQDGAMYNSNPTEIAMDEIARVWPEEPRHDFILSLGTGSATDIISPMGTPLSVFAACAPVRIARWGFSGLRRVLDPRVVHRRVRRTLHAHDRTASARYFRLDLELDRPLPRLVDVTSMPSLVDRANQRRDDPVWNRIRSAAIAASFFFEFDGPPVHDGRGRLACVGTIRIRGETWRILELLRASRVAEVRFAKDDEDLAGVRPPDCLCTACGRFSVRVRFTIANLTDAITLAMRWSRGGEHRISGFPGKPVWFLSQQRLRDPFAEPLVSAHACQRCSRPDGAPPITRKRRKPGPPAASPAKRRCI